MAVMDVDARASFTAETMALQRAFESHRPLKSRLFSDPYADAAGVDSHSPIVLVWEGVTNYLSEHAVHDTLSTIRRLSATPHAALIATYVDIRALDDPSPFPEARRWVKAVRDAGEPWTFGPHPQSAAQYFHDRGYQVRRDVSTKDAGQQLLRGLRRTEQGSALYRVLVADITPL